MLAAGMVSRANGRNEVHTAAWKGSGAATCREEPRKPTAESLPRAPDEPLQLPKLKGFQP